MGRNVLLVIHVLSASWTQFYSRAVFDVPLGEQTLIVSVYTRHNKIILHKLLARFATDLYLQYANLMRNIL